MIHCAHRDRIRQASEPPRRQTQEAERGRAGETRREITGLRKAEPDEFAKNACPEDRWDQQVRDQQPGGSTGDLDDPALIFVVNENIGVEEALRQTKRIYSLLDNRAQLFALRPR